MRRRGNMIITILIVTQNIPGMWWWQLPSAPNQSSQLLTNKQHPRASSRNSRYLHRQVLSSPVQAVNYFSFPCFCSARSGWGFLLQIFQEISSIKLTWCSMVLTQHIPPLTVCSLQSTVYRQTTIYLETASQSVTILFFYKSRRNMIMICFSLYFLLIAAYIMLMSTHNTITDILSISHGMEFIHISISEIYVVCID